MDPGFLVEEGADPGKRGYGGGAKPIYCINFLKNSYGY